MLLRARFDEHAKELDMRKAVQLLKEGEDELFSKIHPVPRACEYWNIITNHGLDTQPYNFLNFLSIKKMSRRESFK